MVLLYKELVSIKGVSKLAPWSKGKRVLLTLVVILLPLLLLGGGGYFAFTEFKANFSNGLPENMYLQDGEEAPSWEDFMKQMEEYEDFDLEDLDLEGLEDLELDYNPEV